MSRLGAWLLRGVGLVLLAWLIDQAEWQQLSILLAQISLGDLYVLPLLTAVMIGLRAWRWNLLLAAQDIKLSLSRAWAVYAIGVFLGSFTPGRLGDLAKVFYLRQERRVSWERAVAGALLDRLFDVCFMLVVAVWAVYHLDFLPGMTLQRAIAGVGIGLVFAFLVAKGWNPEGAFGRWLRNRRLFAFVGNLKEEASGLLNRAGIGAFLLTLLAYSVYFTQTALLARALGLELSVADVSAAIVLVGLAAFLPISVAGLGTREGILALIMARKGIPDSLETALMFSGLFFSFCFVVPGMIGFACWLKNPLPLTVLKQTKGEIYPGRD